MIKKINKFEGKYKFLSNFYSSEIVYLGITYPTVEHAFQAQKTLDMKEKLTIAHVKTPGDAKRIGRRVKLRNDWEHIKIQVMKNLIRLKFFTHKDLAKRLIETGDSLLIEGNWWKDTFWGECPLGNGLNMLGKILMEVREELRISY